MSQSFNFPANPTLNQIVVLPDGNQAQWNGYTWVSVTNNVTYPLPVPSGGTGATNPLTAKRNLAIPIWTLDDAAPAAPVFGDRWIRPGSMTEVVWLPNANPGGGGVWVNLADAGSVAYPIPVSKGGTGATDAATARINLGITNTNIGSLPIDGSGAMTGVLKISDGTVAAPGLAWASEPGLGFYRSAASEIGIAAQGAITTRFSANTAASTSFTIAPRTAGSAVIYLDNQPLTAANYNLFQITCSASGYTLGEFLGGTATAQPLAMNFPAGVRFTSASNPSVSILDVGSTVGANFKIQASGGSKTFRMNGANLEIVNSAYSLVCAILSDAGQFSAVGGYQSRAGFQGAVTSNSMNFYWGNAGLGGGINAYVDTTLQGILAYSATSDERMKQDIAPLESDEAAFMAVEPIAFRWKEQPAPSPKNPEQINHGFSAQNVHASFPELVPDGFDKLDDFGNPSMASIDAPGLSAHMWARVKNLIERVRVLEARP